MPPCGAAAATAAQVGKRDHAAHKIHLHNSPPSPTAQRTMAPKRKQQHTEPSSEQPEPAQASVQAPDGVEVRLASRRQPRRDGGVAQGLALVGAAACPHHSTMVACMCIRGHPGGCCALAKGERRHLWRRLPAGVQLSLSALQHHVMLSAAASLPLPPPATAPRPPPPP